MSNMDATRVMGTPAPGGAATMQMPAGEDAFRTQMGGTVVCPICKSNTPLQDAYCGDCGYLLASEPAEEVELPVEETPAAELVDELTGRRYRLRLGANTIGRQGTDVLSTDATVSRAHASVTITENGVMIEDLGSSNGTKVGDIRLQANMPVAASPGCTLRFGTWKVTLVRGDAAAAADQTIVIATEEDAPSGEEAQPGSDAEEPQTARSAGPIVARLVKLEGICDDIQIADGTSSVGRKSVNDIVLADPYLSGKHAELIAESSGVYLIDAGSTNGTFVNGQRLEANERQLLLDGDEIQLGQTKYRFETVERLENATGEGDENRPPSLSESAVSPEE